MDIELFKWELLLWVVCMLVSKATNYVRSKHNTQADTLCDVQIMYIKAIYKLMCAQAISFILSLSLSYT